VNIACRDQHLIVGSRDGNIPSALLNMKVGKNPDSHGSPVKGGLMDVYHGQFSQSLHSANYAPASLCALRHYDDFLPLAASYIFDAARR
jgi:hypothetical protein